MFKNLQKRFESTESYVSLVLGIAVVLVVGVLVYNFVANRSQKAATITTSTTDTEKMATSTPGGNHTVVAGETLWSISEKYYKTGYNWGDIAKANNLQSADRVEEGQTLVIPMVTPIMAQSEVGSGEVSKKPETKSYTVVSGDTLWGIAATQYSNGYKWSEIATANALVNPNLIHPGNVLTLP